MYLGILALQVEENVETLEVPMDHHWLRRVQIDETLCNVRCNANFIDLARRSAVECVIESSFKWRED